MHLSLVIPAELSYISASAGIQGLDPGILPLYTTVKTGMTRSGVLRKNRDGMWDGMQGAGIYMTGSCIYC